MTTIVANHKNTMKNSKNFSKLLILSIPFFLVFFTIALGYVGLAVPVFSFSMIIAFVVVFAVSSQDPDALHEDNFLKSLDQSNKAYTIDQAKNIIASYHGAIYRVDQAKRLIHFKVNGKTYKINIQ